MLRERRCAVGASAMGDLEREARRLLAAQGRVPSAATAATAEPVTEKRPVGANDLL